MPLFDSRFATNFFIDWSLPAYACQTLLFSRALLLDSRAAWREQHVLKEHGL